MRAFVALDLPDQVRRSVGQLQRLLASSGADVTWVHPDHLHLTLKFLGDISEGQRLQVEQALTAVTGTQRPFWLTLDRAGAFPDMASPRIIWVGFGAGGDEAVQLARRVEEACHTFGLPKEDRPFAAHVTLGRVRSASTQPALVRALRASGWSPPPAWMVTEVTLYHSRLGAQGPTYTPLARLPLTAAGV